MLPNLSVVMEFLGYVFTNFIFEKFLSHEAPVAGRVTATNNNQTQLFKRTVAINDKNVQAIYAASSLPEANSFPKLFRVLNHFH